MAYSAEVLRLVLNTNGRPKKSDGPTLRLYNVSGLTITEEGSFAQGKVQLRLLTTSRQICQTIFGTMRPVSLNRKALSLQKMVPNVRLHGQCRVVWQEVTCPEI